MKKQPKRSELNKKKSLSVKTRAAFPIVGIGASAGGLDAISRLLGTLGNATHMGFVVIQHLAEKHASHLAEILSRVTPMKVLEVTADVRLRPNRIYVIPPGFDLSLDGKVLRLTPRKESKALHLCVDSFFESLARSLKSNAIGVVLTGAGTDGTSGLKAIKAEGGITFAQDPKTARFDSMPRSAIASGVVDAILTPEEIGMELLRISGHSYPEVVDTKIAVPDVIAGSEEGDPLEKILHLLKVHTHVNFSTYKLTTINRRIQRQMMLRNIDTVENYAKYLESNEEEVKALYQDIFIHVTDFFRDPESFRSLRKNVYPLLIEGRPKGYTIRVWVPGCATGEEAYSLAIALTEFLHERGLDQRLQIFATDISEEAIQTARRGVYSEYSVRNVSAERRERFFEKTKEGFKIRKSIRDFCVFSRHDIGNNPPFPKLDLISCRNVLIYFGLELQKRVFPVFHYALNPNGILWLGQAESPGVFTDLFKPVDKTNKIYRKQNSLRMQQIQFPLGHYLTERQFSPNSLGPIKKKFVDSSRVLDSQRSADQLMLFRYAPAGVIVNKDLEVVQFRGRTVPYLEHPSGAPNHDLLKMAHPEIVASLRSVLQTSKRSNESARKENVPFRHEGNKKTVTIEVVPINPLAAASEREFLVLFESPAAAGGKVGKSDSRIGKSKSKASVSQSVTERLEELNEQLLHELEGSREYQQSLVEEFDATQEELTSANEELQATNEELQSTNEELATAKEELQSSNEELLSTNEELQKRNQELRKAVDELENTELRFKLMVENTRDYAIFMLDPEGRVASWNDGARRFEGYEAEEILGQHLSRFHLEEDILAGKPAQLLKVAAELGRVDDEGWRVRKSGERFWTSVVITALRDRSGKLLGFSRITRDLTERKNLEDRLKLANASLEKRVEERTQQLAESESLLKQALSSANMGTWKLELPSRTLTMDEVALAVFGVDPSSFHGTQDQLLERIHPEDRERVQGELQLDIQMRDHVTRSYRVIWPDGSTHWVQVQGGVFRNAQGEAFRMTGTIFDATEKRLAEEQLKQAIRARDEFLSIASHELKTPITSMKLQFQMTRKAVNLEKNLAPPPVKLAKVLDIAGRQIVRIENLLEDLLDVAKIRSGKLMLSPEPLNLADLVRELVVERFEEQAEEAGCPIHMEIDDAVSGVWDRGRIEQVVINLLTNAFKYAPGKPIRIGVDKVETLARLAISDNGPGIPKEKQALIFERFERATASRNISGLGLGLFIVKQIVEAHGGDIQVESEIGQGTKFIVKIPIEPLRV